MFALIGVSVETVLCIIKLLAVDYIAVDLSYMQCTSFIQLMSYSKFIAVNLLIYCS